MICMVCISIFVVMFVQLDMKVHKSLVQLLSDQNRYNGSLLILFHDNATLGFMHVCAVLPLCFMAVFRDYFL